MKASKTIFTLLIPSLLMVNPVFAEEEQADSKYCGGYARTGFIETDEENTSDESSFAMGGEFDCGVSITDNIDVRVGLGTSIDPGINDSNNAKVHGDFFDANKNSYVMLAEAMLNASFGNVEAHLGRQIFDSPHMDSDDLRIIPNRFEAYQLNYAYNEQFNFGAAFVRQMSGWENGADQSDFIDVGKALGANNGSAYVVWGSYEDDGLSIQAWDYVIEDIENIFYAELVYGADYNNDISYEVGLQYDMGREIGSKKLGNIDADTWGISAALTYKIVTLSAAHNRNHGSSGALASLGGGPFFTSMEDQTLDAVTGNDARSSTIGIEITPLDDLVLGAVYSNFGASNDSVYEVQENNLYIAYTWNNRLTLEGIYADIEDKNSANDKDQLRLILTYSFDGPF
ncbi:MAG: outer membrane porin, OprD family [Proteobacteria bacterium]|nr:outer membrane porin, OprD family [Pseudomonadota bacterium]NOG60655.1 outer membrane porin, OprD family [Pseudomonadota bacterium]